MPGRLRRRLFREHRGDPNVFGSESSFDPPIGTRWNGTDDRRGYYIDFREKVHEDSWPPSWGGIGELFHIAIIQWALGAYELYLDGEGDRYLDCAIGASDHLVALQTTEGSAAGAWRHSFPMPHTYRIEPCWISAITQGSGASLMARMHRETGVDRYRVAALAALEPMRVSVSSGGVLTSLEGSPFIEEYPTDPRSLVLNGAIFGLWGFHDVGDLLGDSEATNWFEALTAGLADNLHRYDLGWWSLYDLYPHVWRNVASPAYHLLHIKQLGILGSISGDSRFHEYSARFDGYRGSAGNRRRAIAEKMAFRLLVPRSPHFAHRMPWNHPSWRKRRA